MSPARINCVYENNVIYIATHQCSCEIFEEDAECHFDTTTSGNNVSGLKASLDDAKSVVDGSLDFIKEEVICSSKNDGAGFGVFATLFKDKSMRMH
mgnify:CR=1 FL=1